MEEEISLVELFQMLRDHLGKIIITTVIGLVLAFIYTYFMATPVYQSQAQLLVNRPAEENIIQQAEINANIQLINTYEDIILNPIILFPVIEETNLNYTIDELRNMISVVSDDNSQVFSIVVQSEDPYVAAQLANSTANVFSEELDSIMNIDNVSIISQGVPNTDPVSPNHTLNLLIGLVLGAIIGIITAFILEMTDTNVKDPEKITELTGWPSLGRVSIIEESDMTKVNSSSSRVKTVVPDGGKQRERV